MINPQPVHGSGSPYRQDPGVKTPPPSVLPPEIPQAPRPPQKKRGRIFRITGVIAGALVLGIAGFAGAMYLSFKSDITVTNEDTEGAARSNTVLNYQEGDDTSKFSESTFKQFGDGRFNILLLGVDKAAGLTDSIQVISVDTITKKANITSLPRDLYVTIPGHGRNKINAAYKFGESDKIGGGSAVMKQIVGSILGIQITNFAMIDFSGLEKLVDAVGGISVNVTDDIYDPYFPAKVGDGYEPFSIKAGVQNMDGRTALRYARSRKTTSDFDRSRRQQLVIDAIRTKAFTAGVITNPVKLTAITTALGSSFKTDMDVSAMKTLAGIYQQIPSGSKSTGVLDTSSELGLLTSSDSTAAGYIAFPKLGYDRYDDVKDWYAKSVPDPLLSKEAPTLTFYPGMSVTQKQLTAQAEHLKAYGYTVTVSQTAQTSTTTQVYVVNTKKPFSKNYLGALTGLSLQSSNPTKATTDFAMVYVPKATPTPIPTLAAKVKPSPSPSPTATPDGN